MSCVHLTHHKMCSWQVAGAMTFEAFDDLAKSTARVMADFVETLMGLISPIRQRYGTNCS